jgi:hypothetical protein
MIAVYLFIGLSTFISALVVAACMMASRVNACEEQALLSYSQPDNE